MRLRLFILCVLGLAVWWGVTWPSPSPNISEGVGQVEQGSYVFNAAGCASCHMAPDSDDRQALGGGKAFKTPFGTFLAPNISPNETFGIGGWSFASFAGSMRHGVSPEGKHYFPVFPYTSYQNMTDQDLRDLWAYMQTLPAVETPNEPHQIALPFSIRRNVGVWKWINKPNDRPDIIERGDYLVNALGHCAECHTPRNAIGGMRTDQWLQGGPNPSGPGKIPGITGATLDWSAEDIAEYLRSGFTPDYDVAGGEMVDVIANTSRLTDEDRLAIGRYLKGIK